MKKIQQMLPRATLSIIVVTLIFYCLVLFLHSAPAHNNESITKLPLIEQNTFVKDTAIPIGNGSWLYDTAFLEKDLGDGKYWRPELGKYYPITTTVPGLFAGKVFTYNAGAGSRKKINQIYSYAATPETSCKTPFTTSSKAAKLLNCSADNRREWDNGEIFIAPKYEEAFEPTQAYLSALTPLKQQMNTDFMVIPVVDGRLDQRINGFEPYLDSFNNFNRKQAEYLAEKTAALFCTSNDIPSVQFDIEPFNFDHPGQEFYYEKLAFYFSGQGDPLINEMNEQVYCKNTKYPYGRSWSVFTFAHQVSPAFSQIMNRYGNGYVIIAGYDMENTKGAPAGIHNDVDTYQRLFREEVQETMSRAQQQNFYYKIAIPAASSVHEFTTILGQDPKGVMQDGTLTGQFKRTFSDKTLDYTKAAIEVINNAYVEINGKKLSLLDDPKFIGTDLWGWASHIRWPLDRTAGQTEFKPGYPPLDVLLYLQENLPVSRYYFSEGKWGTINKTEPFKAVLTVNRSTNGTTTYANYTNTVYTATYFGISQIDNIKFYDGDMLLAEDDHLPYQYINNDPQSTSNRITVKAFYKNSLVAESSLSDYK